MPKIFGKTVSPVVMVGMGAAATYLAVTVLFPEEPPVVKKPTSTRKATVKATGRALAYTEQDYSYKYAAVAEPVRNSFRPLVVRQDAAKIAAAANANPGGIPTGFAAGDGNWVFSGRVVVDGVNQALLENRKTGDAEFVVRGQRWRNSSIGEITADTLTMSGPNGETISLIAGASGEPAPTESVTTGNQPAPVTLGPGLQGQIGIQPVVPEGNRQDRPRRRNRRNWDNTTGMEE